ncbi:hypothetical protein HU200_059256 [Digitaria exilis]|uniref:FBD domain-containing protein n=1 Tax=Digitaria exilis TaxID=1010633 RepID=A0A835ALY8_9POAL|nr:hypothetical protein HU200_059256 [Digitaria exilis]
MATGGAKRQRVVRREAVGTPSGRGLARRWRDLWKSRWPHRTSVEVRLSSPDAPRRELDALAREPRPRPRLGRFSLVVKDCKLKSPELRRFTDYAAECRVEDLYIGVRMGTRIEGLLHFPMCSPLLARLTLRRVGIINSPMYYTGAQPFRALEPDSKCKKRSLVMPPKLRTVTIADCWGFANLNLVPVPSLRSFCYRGNFVDAPFFLPRDAALGALYIRFADSVAELHNTRKLRKSLPKDLSGLNVLTICWNALELPASSDKPMEGGSFDEVWEEPPEDDLDNPMEGGSFDEVWEEPPEDDLDNLLMVKVMNFNWHCSEVQLVGFLLRKASSLRKLLIVSPNVTPPPDLPCVESDFLLIKEALTNGKIILSESDDAGIQPYHSKVFIMV